MGHNGSKGHGRRQDRDNFGFKNMYISNKFKTTGHLDLWGSAWNAPKSGLAWHCHRESSASRFPTGWSPGHPAGPTAGPSHAGPVRSGSERPHCDGNGHPGDRTGMSGAACQPRTVTVRYREPRPSSTETSLIIY